MSTKLPIAKSPAEEIQLRKTYRGAYIAKWAEEYDTENDILLRPAVDQERRTRFEYLDPTPVEVPIYLRKPETTDDRIRRLMNEQREYIAFLQRDDESEDEEMDFDVDEVDPDNPGSPFEFVAQASENIRRNERIRRYKEKRAKPEKEAPTEPKKSEAPPEPKKSEAPPEPKNDPPKG